MICNLCPRRCGAERTESHGGGFCAMPAGAVAARAIAEFPNILEIM